MLDERLTRAAPHAHVRSFRQFVGTTNPLHILWSKILAGLRQQILQCAPLGRSRHVHGLHGRQRLFWIDGHYWDTSIDDTYGYYFLLLYENNETGVLCSTLTHSVSAQCKEYDYSPIIGCDVQVSRKVNSVGGMG